MLKRRNGVYRRLWEAENQDQHADGIPGTYPYNHPKNGPPYRAGEAGGELR